MPYLYSIDAYGVVTFCGRDEDRGVIASLRTRAAQAVTSAAKSGPDKNDRRAIIAEIAEIVSRMPSPKWEGSSPSIKECDKS